MKVYLQNNAAQLNTVPYLLILCTIRSGGNRRGIQRKQVQH